MTLGGKELKLIVIFLYVLQGIMLVFDICNRRSFEAIPRWLTYVRQVRPMILAQQIKISVILA